MSRNASVRLSIKTSALDDAEVVSGDSPAAARSRSVFGHTETAEESEAEGGSDYDEEVDAMVGALMRAEVAEEQQQVDSDEEDEDWS